MTGGTVLISDATYRQSIALARYLKEVDPSLHIVGCTKHSSRFQGLYQVFYRKFYDSWVVGPFAEKIQEISHFLAIPVGSYATKLILSANDPQAVVPSQASFDIAMSTEDTFLLARKLKIATPKTFYPVSLERLLTINLPYPWVIKGVLDSDKNIIHVVHNIEEARKSFYAVQNYVSQRDNPPIIQEYSAGHNIVFNAFYQQGVLKRYYIHQNIREFPYTGGSCTAAETIDHPKAFDCGKRVLDELKWKGFASVEFRENMETGELTLIKINPKFGDFLEIGLAAGVNFGDLLVRTMRGEELTFSREYAKIKFYWPFEGDLVSIFRSRKWGDFKDYFQSDYLSNGRTNGFFVDMIGFAKSLFLPYS